MKPQLADDMAIDQPKPAPHRNWTRAWPLAILALGLAAFIFFDLGRFISFEQLKTHRIMLQGWVAAYPVLSFVAFVLGYAMVTALSLPVAALVSVTSGFLFGTGAGAAANVIAATMGATIVFLAARSVLGDVLRRTAGPVAQKLEAGFKENALSYLLALRLIPAFPFFMVNIVAALLGVKLSTFVIGTFFGIIPGSFVFASIGSGLGSIFDRGDSFTLQGVLTPEIMSALVGLGVLSLLPVAYKAWKGHRSSA